MKNRGALLRIDLTTEKMTSESIPQELCHKYLGGEGINSWLLWEHFLKVDPKIDPLSPDNVLIAGVGPLGGTGCGGGTKMKWTFKSPAYHIFGDSASGGTFPTALRWAGYDHMVITGRASRPLYLWIDNQRLELRDASRLWGKNAHETDDLIKAELGDAEIETAAISNAAENGVTFASLAVSRHRAAGRTGAGALFASKNLKAIAVRGTRGLSIHDPAGFFKAINELIAGINKFPRIRDGWRTFGTISLTSVHNRMGVNAYRNNQLGILPEDKYRKLDHRWYNNNLAASPLSCSPGCVSACSGTWKIKGTESPQAQRFAGETGFKPEYGAVASWGICLDIPDWPTVAHLWEKCRGYGMDVIEMGAISGLLMELWQRGIITPEDTAEWFGEPVSLEWGNAQAAEKIIEAIGTQKNKLGQLFRQGLYKGAQRLGELKEAPVLQYALYGKGGAAFVEDIRNTVSWAVNFAVASRGCDHLKALGTLDKVNRPDIATMLFGRPDAAEPYTTTLKGASSALAENWNGVVNSLGVCAFLTATDPLTCSADILARLLSASTGQELIGQELWVAGERVVNLEKAFNSRLGLRRQDDRICERWMKEPMVEGPSKGWKASDYLEAAMDEYYQWHGWDKETSLQTRKKLEELDMKDVARVLKKEDALA